MNIFILILLFTLGFLLGFIAALGIVLHAFRDVSDTKSQIVDELAESSKAEMAELYAKAELCRRYNRLPSELDNVDYCRLKEHEAMTQAYLKADREMGAK